MSLLAWHFVNKSRTLRDGAKVRKGGVYRLPKGIQPELCKVGYHASVRPLDALNYAPGPIVCRVELRGTIVQDTDKAVATERKVLWVADATVTLHKFACWCTERALWAERMAGREPDPRSWEAIRTERAWLRGEATDADLSAAAAAARWSARWSARSAESAESAARSAAESARWSAARSARWSAAGSAASAESAAQNRWLATVLGRLGKQ